MAIQNSVGFAITIISIALATSLFARLRAECSVGAIARPGTGTYWFYPLWGKSLHRASESQNP